MASSVYVLMFLYLGQPADDYYRGRFDSFEACQQAKVSANPEHVPDAITCVKVERQALTRADLSNREFLKRLIDKD